MSPDRIDLTSVGVCWGGGGGEKGNEGRTLWYWIKLWMKNIFHSYLYIKYKQNEQYDLKTNRENTRSKEL